MASRTDKTTSRAAPYDKGKKSNNKKPAKDYVGELRKLEAIIPRGVDCSLDKSSKALQKCTILASGAQTKLYKDLSYRLDHYSQNPTVIISKPVAPNDAAMKDMKHEIAIGFEHMEVEAGQTVEATILRQFMERDEVNQESVASALGKLNVPRPSDEDLDYLIGKHSGFAAFSFKLKRFDDCPLVAYSPKGMPLPIDDELRDLVQRLRTGERLTVCRANLPQHREVVDQYWMHRLAPVFAKGIYPDYEPFAVEDITNSEGETSQKTNLQQFLDGTKECPDLAWMEKPKKDDEEDIDETGETVYAQFAPREHFTSLAEYQILMTLALVCELQYQRKTFGKVFNHSVKHKAVSSRKPGTPSTWNMKVLITAPSDFTLPKIPDGTTFQLQRCQPEDEAERDMELDDSQMNRVFKMQKVTVKRLRRGALVLEWDEERDKEVPWTEDGQEINVLLKMDYNQEPAERSFRSLERIAKLGRCHLTELLLGRSFDNLPRKDAFSNKLKTMPKEKLGRLRELLSDPKRSLNFLQWQGFDLPFFSGAGVSFLQGPPGTGKSLVISWLTAIASIMEIPVVICAPSQAATMSVGKKVISQIDLIKSGYPELAAGIKMTILPTKKTSENLAKEALFQCEETSDYSSDEQKSLRKYQWWYKALQEGLARFESRVDGDKHDDWHSKYLRMQQKEQLSLGQWRHWFKHLDRFDEVINSQTSILVSTCNNIDRIKGANPDFLKRLSEEGMVIIDEAGFDQEYSACIPAALNAKHCYLVGDHRQLQPIVASILVNIWAFQTRLSIFERMVENMDVDFVALKATYRLPRRCADILGVLSGYNGLLTLKEEATSSEIWKAYSEWFESSQYAKLQRPAPPPRQNSAMDVLPKDARRKFLNVNGRSGKSPTSMSSVNYANINVICDYVTDFQTRNPTHAGRIVVQAPFAAQRDEIEEQFELRGIANVDVLTIDSFQGEEDDIVIVCLTNANWNDPAFIGFLRNWNRPNVAFSRCKTALVLVGNMDLWRTRIGRLFRASPNFAMFLMDIVERGDIVDIDQEDTKLTLPCNADELASGNWSMESPQSQPMKSASEGERLPQRPAKARGVITPDSFSDPEVNLVLKELDKRRQVAREGIANAKAAAKEAKQAGTTTGLLPLIDSTLAVLEVEGKDNLQHLPREQIDELIGMTTIGMDLDR